MSSKYLQDGESYLEMYPKLRKWINQCIACHAKGYKPELPEDIYPGVAAKNLRRYFKELSLSESGLCSNCDQITRPREQAYPALRDGLATTALRAASAHRSSESLGQFNVEVFANS